MPREGVPYPERLLCSLRCEIKNIWNALSGKLHSINGVEGDGQGNVTIVSENAALTVNDYPLSNQIGLSLDTSQLPAADVNSVNGQTGVVVLNADDIPSDGSSDVQADIDALKAADTTLQGNINAEATARGNADSALQTNINNITASLPAEAAAAVAADPTIASLVNADSQNVKLSGNQSIGGIKTVSTQATGSFDSQIANSSKVKNELDNYPYVVRTVGNQTIAGVKAFSSQDVHNNGVKVVRSYDAYIHQEPSQSYANGNVWSRRVLLYQDANGVNVCYLQGSGNANGTGTLTLYVRNSDGTYKSVVLAAGDVI